jgi:hypothetical protein
MGAAGIVGATGIGALNELLNPGSTAKLAGQTGTASKARNRIAFSGTPSTGTTAPLNIATTQPQNGIATPSNMPANPLSPAAMVQPTAQPAQGIENPIPQRTGAQFVMDLLAVPAALDPDLARVHGAVSGLVNGMGDSKNANAFMASIMSGGTVAEMEANYRKKFGGTYPDVKTAFGVNEAFQKRIEFKSKELDTQLGYVKEAMKVAVDPEATVSQQRAVIKPYYDMAQKSNNPQVVEAISNIYNSIGKEKSVPAQTRQQVLDIGAQTLENAPLQKKQLEQNVAEGSMKVPVSPAVLIQSVSDIPGLNPGNPRQAALLAESARMASQAVIAGAGKVMPRTAMIEAMTGFGLIEPSGTGTPWDRQYKVVDSMAQGATPQGAVGQEGTFDSQGNPATEAQIDVPKARAAAMEMMKSTGKMPQEAQALFTLEELIALSKKLGGKSK